MFIFYFPHWLVLGRLVLVHHLSFLMSNHIATPMTTTQNKKNHAASWA
jgi:hypothetical protein